MARSNCLRVSRAWAGALQDPVYKGLWSALVFPQRRFQPPSNTALQKLLARARGGMRELEIADPGRFQLTPQKLTALMRSSQALERLVLGPLTNYYFVFPKGPGLYQRLRHVAFDIYNFREHRRWHREDESAENVPVDFIKNIAQTLEHLDLVGVPANWCMRQDMPEFPRLRHLRLARRQGRIEEPLPIVRLVPACPFAPFPLCPARASQRPGQAAAGEELTTGTNSFTWRPRRRSWNSCRCRACS